MAKVKVFDDSIAVGRSYSRIKTQILDAGETWLDGEVVTPYGIVSIYSQGAENRAYHTRLDFVCNGRLHMRSFRNKRYSARGIVTKANEFALYIAKQKEPTP